LLWFNAYSNHCRAVTVHKWRDAWCHIISFFESCGKLRKIRCDLRSSRRRVWRWLVFYDVAPWIKSDVPNKFTASVTPTRMHGTIPEDRQPSSFLSPWESRLEHLYREALTVRCVRTPGHPDDGASKILWNVGKYQSTGYNNTEGSHLLRTIRRFFLCTILTSIINFYISDSIICWKFLNVFKNHISRDESSVTTETPTGLIWQTRVISTWCAGSNRV
jgi:hypothetical protein